MERVVQSGFSGINLFSPLRGGSSRRTQNQNALKVSNLCQDYSRHKRNERAISHFCLLGIEPKLMPCHKKSMGTWKQDHAIPLSQCGARNSADLFVGSINVSQEADSLSEHIACKDCIHVEYTVDSSTSLIVEDAQKRADYMKKLSYKKKRRSDHAPTLLPHNSVVGTFDGASQAGLSGGGGTINLLDGRTYHFKIGLGKGSNNRAELLSLWALMWIARKLHINSLEILGDSKLIIDWVNGKNTVHQVALLHWFQKIITLKSDFEQVSFHHHYREYNTVADSLSKEALTLKEGVLLLREADLPGHATWE